MITQHKKTSSHLSHAGEEGETYYRLLVREILTQPHNNVVFSVQGVSLIPQAPEVFT